MALVVQKEPFICFLSVDAGFKAAIDYGNFHANEWQSIVGCYFHRQLNGGMGFIETSHVSKSVASYLLKKLGSLFSCAKFSSTEHVNAFALSAPNGDPIDSAINRLKHPTDLVQTLSGSPVRIRLPFKDKKSADMVRRQLGIFAMRILEGFLWMI